MQASQTVSSSSNSPRSSTRDSSGLLEFSLTLHFRVPFPSSEFRRLVFERNIPISPLVAAVPPAIVGISDWIDVRGYYARWQYSIESIRHLVHVEISIQSVQSIRGLYYRPAFFSRKRWVIERSERESAWCSSNFWRLRRCCREDLQIFERSEYSFLIHWSIQNYYYLENILTLMRNTETFSSFTFFENSPFTTSPERKKYKVKFLKILKAAGLGKKR